MKKISGNRTLSPLFDKIWRGVLWIMAGTTILLLLWIIGSILFQGFVTMSSREYPVIPAGSKTVFLDDTENVRTAFIINSGVRTEELTAADIMDFYSGEKTDWVIAGQDLNVTLFSPPSDRDITLALRKSLTSGSVEASASAKKAATDADTARIVSQTPGAIGCVSLAQSAVAVAYGTRIIHVPGDGPAGIAVIVNGQNRLTELSSSLFLRLFSGEERNWTEGGANVPVVPVLSQNPATYSSLARLLDDAKYFGNVTFTKDDGDMIQKVKATPGSIGYIGTAAIDAASRESGVRVVLIRHLALFANPAVFEIKNNMRFTSITEAQMRDILSGTITNWSRAGGIPLQIQLVSPVPGKLTDAEFLDALSKHPGGIGMGNYFTLGMKIPEQIVPVVRQEITQNLSLSFLTEAPAKSSRAGGISTLIGNTLLLIIITLLLSVPIGIGAAVYLVEYAKQGFLVKLLRFFTETLAGIPSIIYGLFGYILFRVVLHMKEGLLPAGLTLTIMILPTIIRTAEEALKAVPRSYRFESYALGATMWQTIRRVILPAASPGIITGIILAIGRVVGETAAVLFTCGTGTRFVLEQGFDMEVFTTSARVLALHIFFLFKEGAGNIRAIPQAYATSTILIIVILGINLLTSRLVKRMNKLRK